jgi:Tfp pilus assembly protein PilN
MENQLLKKRLKIAGVITLIGLILFIVFYQMNSSNQLLENERNTLNQEIVSLKNEIQKIQGISYKTKQTRDSLSSVLKPYKPYETMMKSTAQ